MKSVQEFIPIDEIRDGVVILKGGAMRAILLASSVNFDLKSADEQTAILSQFQSFLNSLDFAVQFFIQSRKKDIRAYMALLESRKKESLSELMRKQITEYMEFIKTVTSDSNVMSKSFFIVVPFTPNIMGSKKSGGLLAKLFPGKRTASKVSQDTLERFEENRSQLDQRKSIVAQGLARVGIRTVALGTEELVELFYKLFNPGDSKVPTAKN